MSDDDRVKAVRKSSEGTVARSDEEAMSLGAGAGG
jgi:hypothetical protein